MAFTERAGTAPSGAHSAAPQLAVLTKAQLKKLRSLSHRIKPLLIIGKNNITDAVLRQADSTIEQRELIKCQVLSESDVTAEEAASDLAEKLGAAVVTVIGNRAVLFRRSHRDDIEHIRLDG